MTEEELFLRSREEIQGDFFQYDVSKLASASRLWLMRDRLENGFVFVTRTGATKEHWIFKKGAS